MITPSAKAKKSPVFTAILERHEKYQAPKWLSVNPAEMKVEVIGVPMAEDAEQGIDMRQVVEFYSRT